MSPDQVTRRHDDGRKVYVVGPIERWLIAAAAGGLLSISYAIGTNILAKLDVMQASSVRIELAQAVTASDVNNIRSELSAMKVEVQKIPHLDAEVKLHARELNELKKVPR